MGEIMKWCELFTIDKKPTSFEICDYINNPLWNDLCHFIEHTFSVIPLIEYSKCSAARGWNVKYKIGSKSLCTLYPNKNLFTCLIVIGCKESMETELRLSTFETNIQDLYQSAKPFNGSRWLMIDVTNNEFLTNVKELINIRVSPKK